jgi:pimeloyl-ACP methyl ester carboxylesterase
MATARSAEPPVAAAKARGSEPAARTEPAETRTESAAPRLHDQTRARYPERVGFARRDGGRIAYEVYGSGDPPIVFVPPWQIVHSRVWKTQIPEFARRHQVIAWDNRGNGRSDRPGDPEAHTTRARAANLRAVIDEVGVSAAVLVGLSSSSGPMVVFAAEHPDRVLGLVFVCPASPFGGAGRRSSEVPFEEPLPSDDGWNKENIHFWNRDYETYLEFFFNEAFPEPHSTKQREDAVGYGLDTDPEALAATMRARRTVDPGTFAEMCASIRSPTLVIQGTDDRITDVTQGSGLAGAIPGARLELIKGGGHIVNSRDPVRVNLLIRSFLGSLRRPGGGHDAGA